MSTATKPPPTTGSEQVTSLTFEPGGAAKFIDVLARPEGRLYYRNERVTIVAPSFAHEQGLLYLGSLIELIVEKLEIGCRSARSTLAPDEEDHRWRRRLRTWAREVLGPRRILG